MKAAIVLFTVIFFSLTFGGINVNGQTVAIGHVSAEIVESISASSAAITDFQISNATGEMTAGLAAEALDLGAITVFSGKDITCNVVLQSASMNDSMGNEFTIDTALTNEGADTLANSNGSKTFQLGGTTNMADGQTSGLYAGSYTVIFAYN